MKKENWKPNLFVPGFPKSGSTSLCEYFGQHPMIFLGVPKEPSSLFVKPILPPLWWGGDVRKPMPWINMDGYKKIFQNKEKFTFRVDGSQPYIFAGKKMALNIKNFSPNAKVILVIRDPITRVHSTYNFFYRDHRIKNFEKYVKDYLMKDLDTFLYEKIIKDYYSVFGKNLLIIESKSLWKSPQKTLDYIFSWLNLKKIKVKENTSNPTTITTTQSIFYKELIVRTEYFIIKFIKLAEVILKKLGLFYGKNWIKKVNPLALFSKIMASLPLTKKSKKSNSTLKLPSELSILLEQDYKKSIDFSKKKKIFLKL